MKRHLPIILSLFLLTGCAGFGGFETKSQSGVADKATGDALTAAEFTSVKNTADTADALATVNETKLAGIEALIT